MTEEPFFELLGVRVSAAPFDAVVDRVLRAPNTQDRLAMHFATAHTIVEAHRHAQVRRALAQGLVQPDGMPLVWLGRGRGLAVERVCGPDLLPAVVERGVGKGRSHFFYGGGPGVADALAARLAARYPGVRIVGTLSPPFRALTAEEDDAVIDRINQARPDYVWVGLGAPKQDVWLAEHRPRLEATALFAVGAAFDLHAGTRRRAPSWMQRSGLEWLFRLVTEPRRLAARYTVTNATFLGLVLADFVRARLPRRTPQER